MTGREDFQQGIDINEIWERFRGMAIKAASQRHLAPIKDEAVCEARAALIEAVGSFDPSRGVPFPAYAKSMVYGRMRTLFKKYRRLWQREVYPAPKEDEGDFWETLMAKDSIETEIIESEGFQDMLKELTPRQAQLIKYLYMDCMSQAEAAARMDISQQAAAAIKGRALTRLKKIYKGAL